VNRITNTAMAKTERTKKINSESTKHNTENYRLDNRNPTIQRVNTGAPEG